MQIVKGKIVLDCNASSFSDKNKILRAFHQSLFQEARNIEYHTARPWTITVLTDLSITLGRTLNVEAIDWSFPGRPVVEFT